MPDYILEQCDTTPNDTYYHEYVPNLIGLEQAWDITTGSSAVKVGIIDSGIWAGHPDLNDNIDSDYSRDCTVTPIVEGGLTDDDGHGTHVAGIIGAEGGNGQYFAGVCWDVSMVSLKVGVYTSHVVKAVSYAESENIPILNMSKSWSTAKEGNFYEYYDESMKEVISNYNGLFVCSAGNENNDIDQINYYPAVYNLDNMIVVGATEYGYMKKENSNYGKNSVDIFAPGNTMPTTGVLSVEHSYICNNFSDTSAATPLVSGVAALMLSINPSLNAEQLKDIILRSVDLDPNLTEYCVTGGRLNAYKAVNTAYMEYINYETANYTSLNATSHDVWYDLCSECTCRTADASCDECDMCDPCEDCHINYTLLHDWRYSPTDSLTSHTMYCGDCGYTTISAHNWVESGTAYQCTLCKKIAITIPEIAAYLPPDNDEEELTE